MAKYKTINSFSQIPSVPQIASYFIFLMQVLIFAIIIQARYTSNTKRIIMISIYSIAMGIQILITALTSISDPSDSFMIKYRNNRDEVNKTDVSDFLYCDICRSYVNKSSRHCRTCARCVENFDHHCMWINNCIGRKNYKLFLIMIGSTFFSMVIWVISAVLLWAQQQFNNFIGEMSAVWAAGVIVITFIVMIFILILLHIYLNYLGITTYQLVTQNRQKLKINEQQLTQQAIAQANKAKKKQFDQHMRSQLSQQQPTNLGSNFQSKQVELIKQQSTNKLSQNQIIQNKLNQNSEQISQKFVNNKNYNSSQVKMSKIFPDRTGVLISREKQNQTVLYEEDSKSQFSQKQSIRISQFFMKNRSLKILVSNDAIKPQKLKRQLFPNTCSNSRDLNKNKLSFEK